ncbi:MAG: YifB family Mg chelatase-like AAA ATPase [Planctomycetes bacterium]|nr:YifB family Mg chelatase-like AAA ATPase [Planctomycetota bacterium]
MYQRARILSAAVRGVDGELVFVEVQLDNGIPGTSILGLPDSAVRESRDRVKAAIHSSGFDFPRFKVLVNLAPAHTRKEGTWFDLPIALAILAASGSLPKVDFSNTVFVGELALDGTLRPIRGAIAAARAARKYQIKNLFVAPQSAKLCALVDGLQVYASADLAGVARALVGAESSRPIIFDPKTDNIQMSSEDTPRIEDVTGQFVAKRALVIAAAGGHNVLFTGPPGAGKSMLAQRLSPLLPAPTIEEAIEITQVHDLIKPGDLLILKRPFRAPHHSTSRAGLAGGGPELRPGEISLAHRGVLFLDELPEFSRDALEAMRQPLEDGKITIARATGAVTFPADFLLIAAMNPCHCGWRGHPVRPCSCTPRDLSRYQSRASGPLLDRIDLCISVPPIQPSELGNKSSNMKLNDEVTTESAAGAALAARERQYQRWRALVTSGSSPPRENARIPARMLARFCPLDSKCKKLVERAMEQFGLTMRSYGRTLRLSRTIADLDGADAISTEHVAEALGYRISNDSPAAAHAR